MTFKKTILVVGGVLFLGSPFFLTATGVIELPLPLKSEELIPLQHMLRKKSNTLPSEKCDQSATTTPCSELQALQTQGATRSTQEMSPASLVTPSPDITQMYNNAALGFSLKYPEGYQVQEDIPGRITILNMSDMQTGAGKKVRGVIIDVSASGAGFTQDYLKGRKLRSLSDFQTLETKVTDPTVIAGTPGLDTREVTQDNKVLKLPNGLSVLSQKHGILAYNVSGNEDPEPACDGCELTQRYVLFKDSEHYIVISPLLGDPILEGKIIQSIEYK